MPGVCKKSGLTSQRHLLFQVRQGVEKNKTSLYGRLFYIPYRKVRNEDDDEEEEEEESQSLIGRFVTLYRAFEKRDNESQSLIGRFVTLHAPHEYCAEDFNTLAGLGQCLKGVIF